MVVTDLLRPRTRSLARSISATPVALTLLVVTGATIMCALGLLAGRPDTFADEAIYVELARHLGASGRFEILGVPFPALTYGPAYVALLAPIFRTAGTAREAYMMIRGLNALIFATAAIPTFLIAVRAISRRSAFIVAAVAIALPASAYTVKVLTESLAYPVVLWSVLAALRVLERRSKQRQSVLLLLVLSASAARFELLVLGPALALACVLAANGTVRFRCRTFMPLIIGTSGVVVGALGLLRATSQSGAGAGAHGFDIQHFSIARFVTLTLSSLGAIDLYSGVLPFASLIIVGVAMRHGARWVSPDLRRIVVTVCIGGLALLVAGSAYLATVPLANRPLTPADRYVLYVAPLLFIIFAAWIESGAIRRTGTKWVAAGATLLPVVAALVGVTEIPRGDISGLAFLPWMGFSAAFPTLWLPALAAYCALCAFLLFRRRFDTHGLIKPVAALVSIASACAFFSVISSGSHAPPPGWLDAHSRPGVIAVWAGDPRPVKAQGLWEIDVSNRNLSAVYFTRKPDMFGKRVEKRVIERADGTLLDNGRPIMASYVLTTTETQIVGALVAKSKGFAIYKVRPPVRLDHSYRWQRQRGAELVARATPP